MTNNFRAVFGVTKKDLQGALVLGLAVRDGMSGNPTTFTEPRPTMAVLGTQVSAYNNALAATTRKVPGSVPTRNETLTALWSSLGALRAYTQTLADTSPDHAETIIKASGFKVGGTGVRAKPILDAAHGVGPGDVVLTAHAALLRSGAPTTRRSGSAAFRWRHSVNAGTIWIEDTPTNAAHTTLHGLPSGQTVSFQVCVVLSNVSGPWTDAVTLMIH